MLDSMKERFKFDYESNSSASYLIVRAGLAEKVQHYQVEMIANNPNPGILPLDVRQKDDTVNFYYNITSKITLSQFLKRKKLTRNEFLEVLSGITKIILESKNYLLSDKCFLLDEEYIYINPGNLDVSFAYLPVALEVDTVQVFKTFLINMLVYSANIDESGSDNFLQRILTYAKQDTFNVGELDKLLKELKNGWAQPVSVSDVPMNAAPVQEPEMPMSQPEAPAVSVQKPAVKSQQPPVPKNPKAAAPKNIPPQPAKSGGMQIPSAIPGAPGKTVPAQKTPKQTQGQTKMQYKSSSIIIGSVIAAIELIGIVLLLGLGIIDMSSSDSVTNLAGIGIVLFAVDFLVFRKLFDKANLVEKEVSQAAASPKPAMAPKAAPAQKPIDMSKREIRNIPDKQQNQPVQAPVPPAAAPGQDARPQPARPAPSLNDTMIISGGNLNETMILGQVTQKSAYLQGKKDGMVEEIKITKASFLIGRLGDQVDYVAQNNAIGKIHAEIIQRDGNYFIKDLNSRNGTFVNNMRIESNKEYEIKNCDKITLANSEYTFYTPEG